MALQFSHFCLSSSKFTSLKFTHQKPIAVFTNQSPKFTQLTLKTPKFPTISRAAQDGENPPTGTSTDENSANPPAEDQIEKSQTDETTALGMEIKKAMKERAEQKETSLWSGVGEEIREIEWPAFGKVLGTTGVVLGVIAGSSVVLLTVNAVLAELSDRVFAGKGVQDFFG